MTSFSQDQIFTIVTENISDVITTLAPTWLNSVPRIWLDLTSITIITLWKPQTNSHRVRSRLWTKFFLMQLHARATTQEEKGRPTHWFNSNIALKQQTTVQQNTISKIKSHNWIKQELKQTQNWIELSFCLEPNF